MKFITILMTILLAFTMSFSMSSKPAKNTADDIQAQQTAQSMKQAQATVGMPAITQFFEKKMFKMILELRDKSDLVRYAYIVTISGKYLFLGKCLGYGLPYSIQYTNPEKIVVNDWYGGGASLYGTLPQADPNGLFMPQGLNATWLLMIHPKTGEPEPMFVENEIVVAPWPLH